MAKVGSPENVFEITDAKLVREDALAATDLRTGVSYRLPISDETVRAIDLRGIKADEGDFGLLSYDPGFLNTVSCKSAITYIDGERGILRYRGYPIEQLAERCSFTEVAYLLLEGELPTAAQLTDFEAQLTAESAVPEPLLRGLESYPAGLHPMNLFISLVAALGSFHPESRNLKDYESNHLQAIRLIAQVPTLAAAAYRISQGEKPLQPNLALSYVDRFQAMLWADHAEWKPNPVLERALSLLFLLHADHEQNCSTSAVRGVASSHSDPFSALAAGAAALSGPLHGGANEAVIRMLKEIGSVDQVAAYAAASKDGEHRLMGFGHRIYKSYDPRAKVVRAMAERVFAETGVNPRLEIALELERVALADPYFSERRLYPNVDFYSGLIYEAMGFPSEMFTVLFAVGRTPGWAAHWLEFISDPDRKLARPRQIYTGPGVRDVSTA
ncbi:MAG: citrate synthase [Candidatus Dormibacteraceae bacterium]